MTKYQFEMVDPKTGEMVTVESSVDIEQLRAYNEWVIENKLHPPRFEPEDYAKYLEGVRLRKNVDRVLALLEDVEWQLGTQIRNILTDEE